LGGQSISGWFFSYKGAGAGPQRQPFASLLEFHLGLYLEYHPLVQTFGRGDVGEEQARAYRLPNCTLFPISYTHDGAAHTYLPDWVGTLLDGGRLIAEAGLIERKGRPREQAKLAAARRVVQIEGGRFLMATEQTLPVVRRNNWVFLHARRCAIPVLEALARVVEFEWRQGRTRSVRELVATLIGERWTSHEVEAAAWKVAGDAAAAGHLLWDLDQAPLDLDTPLELLDPGAPPLLPAWLPAEPTLSTGEMLRATVGDQPTGRLPGPTVDDATITPPEARARFLRNRSAVLAVLDGRTQAEVAAEHGLARTTLQHLVRRATTLGEPALVPHGVYTRIVRAETALHPSVVELVRRLYTARLRPTARAIHEAPELATLVAQLARDGQTQGQVPSYWQIVRLTERLKREASVQAARSGLLHPPRARTSPHAYVLSIPAPGLVCQVDEHAVDLTLVTPDGVPIGSRVHGAALICVKTAAILGFVLSVHALTEEDYMRLLKQALEPKEPLVQLYECQHAWPCSAKPAVIFSDRGKIFTSRRAIEVVVDRLGITAERAPAYTPQVKGTVEALFAWTTRRLEHRLPGTTKGNPAARGAYDPERAARRAGITFDLLEQYFVQAITDVYLQEWDALRGGVRSTLWREAVERSGVPRWLGSADELKLLLMRSANRKNPATGGYRVHAGHGLSFLGRWYVSPGLLDRLRGQEVEIRYDRRDLSVIHLFHDGVYAGEAYCTAWAGRRVSLWEAEAERRAQAPLARAADAATGQRLAQLVGEAQAGLATLRNARSRLAARREEYERQLDQQRIEIHPTVVQRVLRAMQTEGPPDPPETDRLPPAERVEPTQPIRRPLIR